MTSDENYGSLGSNKMYGTATLVNSLTVSYDIKHIITI